MYPRSFRLASPETTKSIATEPARPARQLLFPHFLALPVELDDLAAVGAGHQDPAIALLTGPGWPVRLAVPDFLACLVDLDDLVPAAPTHEEVSVGQKLHTAPVAGIPGRDPPDFLAFHVQLDDQSAAD